MVCYREFDEQGKQIDETPGSLVWVRRRNGSWWPGRVMGLDELPPNLSASLKSGTPVKLLGREDGSMDWYNLETSKRIRAFRCEEHEACIMKARAYAIRSKSMGENERKYARREEAILQALDLEKSNLMERKNGYYFPRKSLKVNGQSNSNLPLSTASDTWDLHPVEVKVIERWSSVQTACGSKRKVNEISSGRSQCSSDERFFNLKRRESHQGQSNKITKNEDSSPSKKNSETDNSSVREDSEEFDSADDDSEETSDFNDGLMEVPVVWKNNIARDIFCGDVSYRSSEDSRTESDESFDESESSRFQKSPHHQTTRTTETENSKFGYEMGDQASDVSSEESPISGSESSRSQEVSKERWIFTGTHMHFGWPVASKRSKKSTFSRDQSLSLDSSWCNVRVDVDPIYWGPHSSLISITSRLSGKVIVGQPISVETVEDLENFNIDFFPKHKRSQRSRSGKLMGDTSSMASENKRKSALARKTRRLSLLEVKGKPVMEKEKKNGDCVPLTLVFKRIHEALTSPSGRGSLR